MNIQPTFTREGDLNKQSILNGHKQFRVIGHIKLEIYKTDRYYMVTGHDIKTHEEIFKIERPNITLARSTYRNEIRKYTELISLKLI